MCRGFWVSDASQVLNPPPPNPTPKFSLTPTILVKNSQKYIADPPPSGLPQIEYWIIFTNEDKLKYSQLR